VFANLDDNLVLKVRFASCDLFKSKQLDGHAWNKHVGLNFSFYAQKRASVNRPQTRHNSFCNLNILMMILKYSRRLLKFHWRMLLFKVILIVLCLVNTKM
jgi:hypothetical protein